MGEERSLAAGLREWRTAVRGRVNSCRPEQKGEGKMAAMAAARRQAAGGAATARRLAEAACGRRSPEKKSSLISAPPWISSSLPSIEIGSLFVRVAPATLIENPATTASDRPLVSIRSRIQGEWMPMVKLHTKVAI
ncbi:hypothetical protein J5N97_022461 [Dioscorea zingiberensis]|uniref:Uncharacterized protein n=1 Tax=Dioscorea zingiberensis TaxID=325984 RepID=A0A9D5CAU3_9LILI|nr:hypothetical protein J5N97_022461 [Dioscorea zingiberensis]